MVEALQVIDSKMLARDGIEPSMPGLFRAGFSSRREGLSCDCADSLPGAFARVELTGDYACLISRIPKILVH
jgi:hypothetical protein